MSAQPETRFELSVDQALSNASAGQLRRAIKRKLVYVSHYDDDEGGFIDPDKDSRVEDTYALDEARVRWNRGDKREALHHLEYALGRDFSGLGDLRPEDLR